MSNNENILDVGDTFLVNLKKSVTVNKKRYKKIWGSTHLMSLADVTFIQVGGFAQEIILCPSQIDSIIASPIQPTEKDVLIRGNDYDDLGEVPEISESKSQLTPPNLFNAFVSFLATDNNRLTKH